MKTIIVVVIVIVNLEKMRNVLVKNVIVMMKDALADVDVKKLAIADAKMVKSVIVMKKMMKTLKMMKMKNGLLL